MQKVLHRIFRPMSRKIIIAIDGYSSCGKSTLAKDLAKELSYVHIDSGAMYRAVTLYFLRHDISFEDETAIANSLEKISIDRRLSENAGVDTFLNDENVELEIRSAKVSASVSEVSAIKSVRVFLVDQQRKMGAERGIVMEGRDIGTVVFPDAELKIFLTADLEKRVERRFLELQLKGLEASEEAVRENLNHRDHLDTHREESPLYKADDAILLDNTILSRADQLRLVTNMANSFINAEVSEEE